jgi:hypothetical protein
MSANINNLKKLNLGDPAIDNPNYKVSGSIPSDPFIINNWETFYKNDNYYRIIPSKEMSKIEQLNALLRFFVYLTIIFLVLRVKTEWFYIPFLSIILIIILYFFQIYDKVDVQREEFCRTGKCNNIEACQLPTYDNPFMNATLNDYANNPNRPPACDNSDKMVRSQIDKKFFRNVLRDVDDLYGVGYSQRQFYTTASTTIPNNQDAFAKWLYKMPETCKENQANCLQYEDLRYVRFNPHIDLLEKPIEDI